LSAAASGTGGAWVDIPHTQIRRITASRLLQSKTTVPHYYLSMECQMDNLMALRATINGQAGEKGVKISVNDLIIKASALALKKVPGINASWQPDFIREYKNVDISVAVQTPFGLMVPIVKDADKKGLASISADVKALAAKAKDGKLSPAEFTGGTFTISNLGMYGIRSFAAIINPPQAAILAVGGSDMKVILDKNGKYVEVSTLIATLSCDHRVVDGAVGAQWLNEFKGFLENPITMLL
jgi:pyruvate dehydrogenase E2 component (dihydrolipoamide acetyltransferase)